VTDDYQAKYGALSHDQLYRQLMSGDPDQVEAIAAKLSSLRNTLGGLQHSLHTDLTGLAKGWSSTSGTEYQRRLDLIGTFTLSLHDDLESMHTTLTNWAAVLREAKKHAENPADTDDSDKTVSGAAKGAAVGSVFGPAGTVTGGVIGGLMGHDQDEEEKQKAHDRMIALVAGLAAGYVTADRMPPTISEPDPDTPSTSTTPLTFDQQGGTTHKPGTVGSTHDGTVPGQPKTDPTSTEDVASLAGTGAQAGGVGADGLSLGGLAGGGGGQLLTPGTVAATGLGIAAAGLGYLGAGGGTIPLAGAGLASASTSGGGVGRPNNLFSGVRGGGVDEGALGINRGSGTGTGGAAGRQQGTGEDDEEHSTWLTEDEMVWGDDQPNAPAVLGVEPPPAEH
jgi:hypothetical protein